MTLNLAVCACAPTREVGHPGRPRQSAPRTFGKASKSIASTDRYDQTSDREMVITHDSLVFFLKAEIRYPTYLYAKVGAT